MERKGLSIAIYGCLFFLCSSSLTGNYSEEKNITEFRNKRWLPYIYPYPYPYKRPRIRRVPCVGANNREGFCYAQAQCENAGGVCSGNCETGKGVCCVFQATCGGSVMARVSYFHNPGYPDPYNGGPQCLLTINKTVPYICQLRLDFIDFSLAQPLRMTGCYNDYLFVGDTSIPSICGENSGQHVYVDFATRCSSHVLTVNTPSNFDFSRKWNIKITQIPCNSTQLAPKGCLMYYTATSGTVSSLNYDATGPSFDNMGEWSRQIVGLDYGVCIRPGDGYCSIEWKQSTSSPYTFTVSGVASPITPTVPGVSMIGADCTTSFVVIPNTSRGTDRFCGTAFETLTTNSKPFVLTVVTQYNADDRATRGFQLNYRQMTCRP